MTTLCRQPPRTHGFFLRLWEHDAEECVEHLQADAQRAALTEGPCTRRNKKLHRFMPLYNTMNGRGDCGDFLSLRNQLRQEITASMSWDGAGYAVIPALWYDGHWRALGMDRVYGMRFEEFCFYLNNAAALEYANGNNTRGVIPWETVDTLSNRVWKQISWHLSTLFYYLIAPLLMGSNLGDELPAFKQAFAILRHRRVDPGLVHCDGKTNDQDAATRNLVPYLGMALIQTFSTCDRYARPRPLIATVDCCLGS